MVENKQKGFTIIEVVLVLAIAGLIFMIVFLAVPALQRSRRDTQRRSDAARFTAQLEQYAANKNGSYPTSTNLSTFISGYMDDFKDPSSGAVYNVTTNGTAPGSSLGSALYRTGASCNPNGGIITGSNTRDIAFVVRLETGNDVYCVDNR